MAGGARGRGQGRAGRAEHLSPFHTSKIVPPPDWKPFRDRAVPTRNVVGCPTCGVEAGQKCVTLSTGQETPTCHPSRRRMAVRAERAAREAAQAASSED